MHTETGQIYRTPEAIAAATARGESLAFISERVAALLDAGRPIVARRERQAAAQSARKQAARRHAQKQAKQNRKRSRKRR